MKSFKEWFELNEEKDACYHKVKSRYSVWPSAYASGALVKCRKVGAKNWGNSKKKKKHMQEEGVQIDESLADIKQYNDASMAAKILKRQGYDVSTMSNQEIIDALNSFGAYEINLIIPRDTSPELFAARIKSVVMGNIVPSDFADNESNFQKEVDDVIDLMYKHHFTISFRDPTILASELKRRGWKSRFGLINISKAVLQKFKDKDKAILQQANR